MERRERAVPKEKCIVVNENRLAMLWFGWWVVRRVKLPFRSDGESGER